MPLFALPSTLTARARVSLLALLAIVPSAAAADLVINLPGSGPASRKTVTYRCDATGAKMGLPPSTFQVEYINGGGNSLAVVPINGNPLIFANVVSGSGARYAAQQYIWWEARGSATLYSDSMPSKQQSACQPVSEK